MISVAACRYGRQPSLAACLQRAPQPCMDICVGFAFHRKDVVGGPLFPGRTSLLPSLIGKEGLHTGGDPPPPTPTTLAVVPGPLLRTPRGCRTCTQPVTDGSCYVSSIHRSIHSSEEEYIYRYHTVHTHSVINYSRQQAWIDRTWWTTSSATG